MSAQLHRQYLMTMSRKSLFPHLLIAIACLLAVTVVLLVRHRNGTPTPPAEENPGRTSSSTRPDRPTRTPGGQHPQRGGNAPAASSSDAVAALVGDRTLSDTDAANGLRRIVEDGSRKIDERMEALTHLLNLAPNDQPSLLRDLAAAKVMADEVRQRLAADALNRPHHLQGEILVGLLANAAGDARKELLGHLTFLCGEDLGDDLAAWRKAVEKLPPDP